jgi:hypothetical protein
MKRILLFLVLVQWQSWLICQISMQTNLPSVLALNSEVTFDVKIKKGNATSFSKYQLEVPEGMTVAESDSKLGTFTFEENKAKVIWVITPSEPEYSISLKLNSGSAPGTKNLVQKYFYMENDAKKEVEMEIFPLMVKDSAASSPPLANAFFVTLNPKTASAANTPSLAPSDINTKNPLVLKQQVSQLRKDSKDAFQVGQREQRKAELKLSESKDAIAKAEKIKNSSEKKTALEKANNDKRKAEEDLVVSERVLILAKTLNDNADEIERINKSVNPAAFTGEGGAQVATSSGSPASSGQPTNTTEPAVAANKSASDKDIEKLKESFKATENGSEPASPEPANTSVKETKEPVAEVKETKEAKELADLSNKTTQEIKEASAEIKENKESAIAARTTKKSKEASSEIKESKEPAAARTAKESKENAVSGLVYKVQVGAFSKEPSASDFRSLGKVLIVNESGFFKVLVGGFGTREDALKKREQVISKGFDGFVVSYQNGVRVK